MADEDGNAGGRDPRTSERRDLGVEVCRDLTGGGRVLRGRTTGGHTISFRSTGHRTGGRDPIFVEREKRSATKVAGGGEEQEKEIAFSESAGRQSLFRRLKFWR